MIVSAMSSDLTTSPFFLAAVILGALGAMLILTLILARSITGPYTARAKSRVLMQNQMIRRDMDAKCDIVRRLL